MADLALFAFAVIMIAPIEIDILVPIVLDGIEEDSFDFIADRALNIYGIKRFLHYRSFSLCTVSEPFYMIFKAIQHLPIHERTSKEPPAVRSQTVSGWFLSPYPQNAVGPGYGRPGSCMYLTHAKFQGLTLFGYHQNHRSVMSDYRAGLVACCDPRERCQAKTASKAIPPFTEIEKLLVFVRRLRAVP